MNFWNIRSSRKFRYGRKSQVKEDVNGGGRTDKEEENREIVGHRNPWKGMV